MRAGRPKADLFLTNVERSALESLARTATSRGGAARRAEMVLACAEGLDNCEVARRLGTSAHAVGRWRSQFLKAGVDGLQAARRRGGRRPISKKKGDLVVAMALKPTPAGCVPVSTRQIAEAIGVSHNAVHRIWRSYGIKPHQEGVIDLSADRSPTDKVWDVVGLYLKPPAHALAVCIDARSQVDEVGRGPSRPPRRATMSTDEVLVSGRADAIPLSESVERLSWMAIEGGNRHEMVVSYCRFLDRIDEAVPERMGVHLVVDNYAVHGAREVRDWMLNRSRFQLHLAPTHDSWLDQIDRWFEVVMHGDAAAGKCQSVDSLVAAAEEYLARNRAFPGPFVWTKSADAIRASIGRFRMVPEHQ